MRKSKFPTPLNKALNGLIKRQRRQIYKRLVAYFILNTTRSSRIIYFQTGKIKQFELISWSLHGIRLVKKGFIQQISTKQKAGKNRNCSFFSRRSYAKLSYVYLNLPGFSLFYYTLYLSTQPTKLWNNASHIKATTILPN